jgi:hypothetical protein
MGLPNSFDDNALNHYRADAKPQSRPKRCALMCLIACSTTPGAGWNAALGEDSDLKAARNGALEWLVTTFLAPFRLNARRKVWTGCHGAVCAIPRKRNPVRGR